MFTSLLFASYWFFGFYSVSPSSFFPILILSWFKQRPKCHRALHFSCVSFTLHAHTAAHIHYFCLLMDVVDAVVSTGAKNCTHLCCHGVLFKPQCTQRKGFFLPLLFHVFGDFERVKWHQILHAVKSICLDYFIIFPSSSFFHCRFIQKSILRAAWRCCRLSVSWNVAHVSQHTAFDSGNNSRASFIIVFRFTVSWRTANVTEKKRPIDLMRKFNLNF